MKPLVLSLLIVAGLASGIANAEDRAGSWRQNNQQQRIQQGLDSGALTGREAARLERGQARTQRIEANSAADGHVGPLEQARIQSVENRQSRHIYRKKHNLRHQ